jgi:Flp pilus assembly protein TadD
LNDTDEVERNLALASHWLGMNRPEKCLEVIAQAPPGASDDPRLFALRAAAMIQLERAEEAARIAQQGLAIDAEDPWLLELFAIASMRQGDLVAAERALLDALRLQPRDGMLLARYALVVARAGQLDKARALIERAREAAPEAPYVGQVASLIAFMEGDDRAAVAFGSEALERNPESPGIHALMGGYLLERGNVGRATQHHRIAASTNPGDQDYADLGRQAKYLRHPLMRPIWIVHRFGPMKIWLGYIVLLVLLNAAGLDWLIPIIVVPYLIFVIYSWVVPPIMRRRYRIGR